ncbi:deoxyribose-phosphate aldolase [Halalkalicoccus jeotgali]|uniref:Deoxyribose-phosphate aldolase n=1 Tax=Halalkalicoccus jeotgali (strain DSM 18796 / CECT 7217 / JCM 14584 / KCTC 4019 / B3) TaxID=795797 RepID=D8JAG8_HALJB|nr:deoxyribose-phosphate aldolase [Halalkalicoccus jeotgali]ADJ14690.1 deoxyribose-phosphate aldolase [Halalkalicoccus jeotgali B3]ELY39588.1 deoxyribose-phosphate aldolase [Halalkalicoccus jeotgali B3]
MERTEFAAAIDHTVLGPETTREDVRGTVEEAAEYGMNACIPPCYVEDAAEYGEVTLVTVVGFPHGQNSPGAKRKEAVEAWKAGADELDVVCNRGRLLGGEDERFHDELAEIVAAVPVPVKVIVEASELDEAELRRAAELAVEADAAMLKTSTGFAEGGASVEAVEILAEYLPVKASGGIGDYETARTMLAAGAERIGASSGVALVEGFDG